MTTAVMAWRATRPARQRWRTMAGLLGPAFVAAVAYVDPGNVVTNVSAGARYGYLLVWVAVGASAMAGLLQFLSAKVGLVTGRSLPELVRERLSPRWRFAYWAQAELVAAATDVAEVLGGAIALNLLFGLPVLLGGLVTGMVSMGLLAIQSRRGSAPFERVVMGLLAIIPAGFVAGLMVRPPHWSEVGAGLVPHLAGPDSLLLAAGILGATVMPHVVYLHSALAQDRHGHVRDAGMLRRLLAATRLDVTLAMVLAGSVNVAMLLFAATGLHGAADTGSLSSIQAATSAAFGPAIAIAFALGLLVSGLASTAVGCYAGAVIMEGLLQRRLPLLTRRAITLLPALILLAFGVDPTHALIWSQVALSFGIPLAIIPLVLLTARQSVMGAYANPAWTNLLAGAITAIVVCLNGTLLWLSLA